MNIEEIIASLPSESFDFVTPRGGKYCLYDLGHDRTLTLVTTPPTFGDAYVTDKSDPNHWVSRTLGEDEMTELALALAALHFGAYRRTQG